MSPQDGRLAAALTNPKVVVATTVALSFISFWRGASIVLSDLASSMFYAGGAAEAAVGKAAPWVVLAGMMFCFVVSRVYILRWRMFGRGGMYVGVFLMLITVLDNSYLFGLGFLLIFNRANIV